MAPFHTSLPQAPATMNSQWRICVLNCLDTGPTMNQEVGWKEQNKGKRAN